MTVQPHQSAAAPICDATSTGMFDTRLDCVLPAAHDDPWHRNARGTQWRTTDTGLTALHDHGHSATTNPGGNA